MDAITRNMSSIDAKAYEATPSTLRTAYNEWLTAKTTLEACEASYTHIDTFEALDTVCNADEAFDATWYGLVQAFALEALGINVLEHTTVDHGYGWMNIATIAVDNALMYHCDCDSRPFCYSASTYTGPILREYLAVYYEALWYLTRSYPCNSFAQLIEAVIVRLENVNPTLTAVTR